MASYSWLVVYFPLALIQNVDGSLVLDINPTEITPGLTPSLTINCSFSFDRVTGIANVISLVLAKESHTQFVDLLSTNVFTPDEITVNAQLNDSSTVSGYIEGDDQSFLIIEWSFPSASEAGLYRCEVNGVTSTGHPSQQSQTIMVTSQKQSFDQLISTVSDLQRQLEGQSQTIDNILSLVHTQSNVISEQTDTITDMQQKLQFHNVIISNMAFNISTAYQGHYYLLSKLDWHNATVAEEMCELFGGYLVEINDSEEHEFLKEFLNSTALGINCVLISGTDEGHEGLWTYTYSHGPLNYTNFLPPEPSGGYSEQCIQMIKSLNWQWNDYPCVLSSKDNRFLCEVNIQ